MEYCFVVERMSVNFKEETKKQVHDFWDNASCGEELYLKSLSKEDYASQAKKRYELEPQLTFGEFEKFHGKKTLEIGVGLGADHQQLAEAGAILYGVDLTERAIKHTKRRFELFGLSSELRVADAENLPFPDASFDAVYSWGVIHHSPDTRKAVSEIHRVLKPNGLLKLMIYHKYSIVGYMLWVRYGLLALKPWRSLTDIYYHHLESPGTKAYSRREAIALLEGFQIHSLETPVLHADLLTSDVGQKHRGILLSLAKRFWPRWFIRRFLPNHGLTMMITAQRV
jgi:ubiquinone/menaquinone biosynthesis C-methylase UbiE